MADERSVPSPGQPAALKAVAVIVAHPDDETLWAGGEILRQPDCNWFILSLCRASDPDRAPKYRRVLQHLGAAGDIADLDDGPEQQPLPPNEVEETILAHLPATPFDLILTHGPHGEYTRHRRHEEVSRAVAGLWRDGRIEARAVRMFAYEDGNRTYLPRARTDAHVVCTLAKEIWQTKYEIITTLYGFGPESWEARVTPRDEAMWHFDSPAALSQWLNDQGVST